MLQSMQQDYPLDDYFFIRYFDTAPHIRFRFKTSAELHSVILGKIASFLPEDCEIKQEVYTPEIERYGGLHFMAKAEHQFFASSEVCRQLMLDKKNDWNYNTGLSYALQMHLSLIHTLGLSLPEAQVFFEKVAEVWVGFVVSGFYQKTEEEQAAAKDTTFGDFNQLYQKSSGLKTMVHNLWEALPEEGEFGEPWLDTWIEAMQQLSQDYTQLQTLVEVNSEFLLPNLPNHCQDKAHLFALANSFVHMSNNRLGVYNQDESYLAFIIAQSLKDFVI
jgi:thiopeptide-type bacteriocin biosynthesis protein